MNRSMMPKQIMAYANGGGISSLATVPMQTTMAGQPHRLAYVNPQEEQMLLDAGGAGLPGPGGIPSYWNLFEPSSWGDGQGFQGLSSGSSNSSSNVSVNSGDTLSQIAADNNTTVAALKEANNIADVNKIQAGATLTIPGASTKNSGIASITSNDNNSNSLFQNVANALSKGDNKEYRDGILYGEDGQRVNSLFQNTANALTPGDDKEYRDGLLYGEDDQRVNSFYQNTANALSKGDGQEYIYGDLVVTDQEAKDNAAAASAKASADFQARFFEGDNDEGFASTVSPTVASTVASTVAPDTGISSGLPPPPVYLGENTQASGSYLLPENYGMGSDTLQTQQVVDFNLDFPHTDGDFFGGPVQDNFPNPRIYPPIQNPNQSRFYDQGYTPQNVANQQSLTFPELMAQYRNPYESRPRPELPQVLPVPTV